MQKDKNDKRERYEWYKGLLNWIRKRNERKRDIRIESFNLNSEKHKTRENIEYHKEG